jgi:hypothetical protein
MAQVRVYGFVAAEADVCVLLRQGPSEETLMVRWNLKNDHFESGQWLKGPVSPSLCDLSPDGALFALHSTGRWPIRPDTTGPYLAVSRPPFFTALAFWRIVGPPRCNVAWHGSRELWVDRSAEAATSSKIPEGFLLRSVDPRSLSAEKETRLSSKIDRIEKSGWDIEKIASGGYSPKDDAFRAVWADVDHHGRLLLARGGRISVRDAEGERELIDLAALEFQAVPPKKQATVWPE